MLKSLTIGLVTAVSGAVLGLTPLGISFEERVGLSWLFKIRGPIEAPPQAVIVAIDGRTWAYLGLPELPRDWPRTVHARLIQNLAALGASTIVFDMDFRRAKVAADDAIFADAVGRSGRVVLFAGLDGKRLPISEAGRYQGLAGTSVASQSRLQGTVWVEKLVPPIPPLAEAANALAPFPVPKVQAAVFQYWAFKPSAGDIATMPAVALQVMALEAYELWRSLLQKAGAPGVEDLPKSRQALTTAPAIRQLMRSLRLAFKTDPTLGERVRHALAQADPAGLTPRRQQLVSALVNLYEGDDHRHLNFYGPPGSVSVVYYHEIFQAADPKPLEKMLDLNGKVVFVGFADLYDPGQPDRFYTVFTGDDGVDLSGVEIAATAFGNLLGNQALRPLDAITTLAILLAFGTLLGAGVYLLPALLAVPGALTLAALYGVGAQYLFNVDRLWLPLATPLLVQLPLAVFIGLLAQYLLERRAKRRATAAIAYYVPESIATELTQGRLASDAVNKTVYATCLATDMAGFSTFAETMTPDELARFMNEYFEALSEPLKRYQVDVTEFRADAIMCAWTAKGPDERIRRQALLASLDAVHSINRFSAAGVVPRGLSARIGLEAGWVYVGHAGGGGHFVYSIVGDCANTASRIESLNKQLGTQLLATETVVEGIDGIVYRPLGQFRLVGKEEPIGVVEVLARDLDTTGRQFALCAQFAAALELFQAQQWAKARERFEALLDDYLDDGPTRFYLDRCRSYLERSPPRVDPAVIRLATK